MELFMLLTAHADASLHWKDPEHSGLLVAVLQNANADVRHVARYQDLWAISVCS